MGMMTPGAPCCVLSGAGGLPAGLGESVDPGPPGSIPVLSLTGCGTSARYSLSL